MTTEKWEAYIYDQTNMPRSNDVMIFKAGSDSKRIEDCIAIVMKKEHAPIIAAAPELYERLKYALQLIKAPEPVCRDDSGYPEYATDEDHGTAMFIFQTEQLLQSIYHTIKIESVI